jgi:hypothetical protein
MDMTHEKKQAYWDEVEQELLAGMTRFEQYLYETGQFDAVIHPEIPADHVVVEPHDGCVDIGCEHCIGYWVRDGEVSSCTHECHKAEPREVPYDHCSYTSCETCPETVKQGKVISHCTCPHHRSVH